VNLAASVRTPPDTSFNTGHSLPIKMSAWQFSRSSCSVSAPGSFMSRTFTHTDTLMSGGLVRLASCEANNPT
jgi:hypothetical protein